MLDFDSNEIDIMFKNIFIIIFFMLFLAAMPVHAATQNASNQKYSNNADGFSLGGGTTPRELTVISGDVTLTGGGANTYNFPTPYSGNTVTLVGVDETQTLTHKAWAGDVITAPYGGTGATTLTGVIKGNGAAALTAMTGTANYAARWTDANSLGTGTLFDNGTSVGIGTTSPFSRFDIVGANGPGSTTTPVNGINIKGVGTTGVLNVGVDSSGTFYSWLQSRNHASATYYNLALNPKGGNVGIGTAVPTAKFAIIGSGTTTGKAFEIDNSLYVPKFTVLDNGSVGIGTIDPGALLQVFGDSSHSLFLQGVTSSTPNPLIAARVGSGSNAYLAFAVRSNLNPNALSDSAAVDVRMVLNLNGNLGIGTTIPATKLSVLANSAGNNDWINFAPGSNVLGTVALTLRGYGAGSGYVDSGKALTINYNTGINTGARPFTINHITTPVLTITGGSDQVIGSVGIGTTSPFAKLQVDGSIYIPAGMGNIGVGSVTPRGTIDVDGTIYARSMMLSSGNTVNAITTTVTGSSTNLQIPTAKAVADYVTSNASTLIQSSDTKVTVADGTATPINFTINGLSFMVIDQNGNVGIGTTSPIRPLYVNGAITATGDVNFGNIYANGYRKTINANTFKPRDNGADFTFMNYNELVTIATYTAAGNVGIGTTVPLAKFAIVASGTTTGTAFQIDDSLYVPKVTILDNGNVGIGTTRPVSMLNIRTVSTAVNSLTVQSGTDVISWRMRGYGAAGRSQTMSQNYNGLTGAKDSSDYGSTYIQQVVSSMNTDGIVFGTGTKTDTSPSLRMIINEIGNVGIGTFVPFAKLQVDGSIYIPAGKGSIGIGSVTPRGTIDVDGTIYARSMMLSSGNTVNAITTTVSGSSTNLQIPTAKAVADYVTSNASTIISDDDSSIQVQDNTATPINFTINGSSSMVIDQNGNVGIGTISPMYKLSIFTNGSYDKRQGFFFDNNIGFYRVANNQMGFGSGITSDVIIENGGVLRTANYYRLWAQNTAGYPTYTFNADLDSGIFNPVANSLGFSTGGLEAMRISSGNVGIGSTSPRAKLELVGSGTTTGTAFQIDDSLYAPKVTILDNGNVGLGTTELDQKLKVNGNVSATEFHLGTNAVIKFNATEQSIDFVIY